MPVLGAMATMFGGGWIGPPGAGYDYWIAKFDDQSGTIGYDSVNDKIHLDQGHVGDSPKIITLNMDGSVDQIRVATQLSAGNYVSDSYNNPSVIYEDHWYPAYADTGGGATPAGGQSDSLPSIKSSDNSNTFPALANSMYNLTEY